MDVESAINLFFKGVLLFPIFLLAGYIGVAMMKHMIFHGVPVMNTVTPEQREVLRERDSQIGLPSSQESEGKVSITEEVTQVPVYSEVSGAPGVVTDHEWELVELEYERDMQIWVRAKDEWFRNPTYTPEGESLYPQRPSRDTSKYEL